MWLSICYELFRTCGALSSQMLGYEATNSEFGLGTGWIGQQDRGRRGLPLRYGEGWTGSCSEDTNLWHCGDGRDGSNPLQRVERYARWCVSIRCAELLESRVSSQTR